MRRLTNAAVIYSVGSHNAKKMHMRLLGLDDEQNLMFKERTRVDACVSRSVALEQFRQQREFGSNNRRLAGVEINNVPID